VLTVFEKADKQLWGSLKATFYPWFQFHKPRFECGQTTRYQVFGEE